MIFAVKIGCCAVTEPESPAEIAFIRETAAGGGLFDAAVFHAQNPCGMTKPQFPQERAGRSSVNPGEHARKMTAAVPRRIRAFRTSGRS